MAKKRKISNKTRKWIEGNNPQLAAHQHKLLKEARQYVSDAGSDEDPETQRLSSKLLAEIDASRLLDPGEIWEGISESHQKYLAEQWLNKNRDKFPPGMYEFIMGVMQRHGSGCSLCDAGCEPTKDWKHATADGWVDCTTEAAAKVREG